MFMDNNGFCYDFVVYICFFVDDQGVCVDVIVYGVVQLDFVFGNDGIGQDQVIGEDGWSF